MPAGSTWEEQEGYIISRHEKREEQLEIFVDHIYYRHEFRGELEGKLITLGSEREVGDLLIDQLWRCSDQNLHLIQREYRTAVGPIDILSADDHGNPVAIEIKRGKVTSASVLYQIKRYTDALLGDEQWHNTQPRGILAAKSISLSARALAQEMGIECVLIKYEELAEHAALIAEGLAQPNQRPPAQPKRRSRKSKSART